MSTPSSTTAATTKPDKTYTTTILMMSCLIQALPYDLPTFVPALVTSFVKHIGVSYVTLYYVEGWRRL